MDNLQILERVEAINEEVYELGEANGNIQISEDDRAAPLSEDEFSAFEARLTALSSSLAALFRDAGDLTFAWTSPIPETPGGVRQIEGALRIPNAPFIFDAGYWAELAGSSRGKELGNTHGALFAIDKFSAEWWTVMRPGSATMWLHEPGTAHLHDTSLSFDEWFTLGCEVRYFSGWVFAFVPELTGGDEVRSDLEIHVKPLFASMQLETFDRLRSRRSA